MAAYSTTSTFEGGKPLYFFYDCEATGRNDKEDKIIEIGAILCTYSLDSGTAQALTRDDQHEFSSLVHCTHPISPGAAEILTLTLDDLKDAPKPKVVLTSFFEWIDEMVNLAARRDKCNYTPVLVAHSGNRLDYPLIFKTIEETGSHTLKRKFEALNLHYTDSHSAFRQLARTDRNYQDLPGLGVKHLHQLLLRKSYDGHRALPDAKALHNIFTQCSPLKQPGLFREIRNIIQTKEGIEITTDQVPKFLKARIKPAKAEELLKKGITYEKVLREYQRNPRNFRRYLQISCGITRPKQELLDHFKEKR